jgi:hypothetical protein
MWGVAFVALVAYEAGIEVPSAANFALMGSPSDQDRWVYFSVMAEVE